MDKINIKKYNVDKKQLFKDFCKLVDQVLDDKKTIKDPIANFKHKDGNYYSVTVSFTKLSKQ